MVSETTPIIANLPSDLEFVNIYPIHDVHYGSAEFNSKKWEAYKKKILNDANGYCVWVGDLMENAVPNSKSDMFTQTASPQEQKEWVTEQMSQLKHKTLAVVPGNHESNRTTKLCGLYPLYDCALIAGIGDLYRDTYAIVDVGVGLNAKMSKDRQGNYKQNRYVIQIQHKAKDIKACCSADFTDGIDVFIYGHDHESKDRARKKMVYDSKNKTISFRNVEVINCGSFLEYGGYGAKSGYRPQSDKMYFITLFGGNRGAETRGFYL